ncbi:MAG: hypothetical protein WC819_02165 [Parcubacteria group bacterium]|jgi:hypothetical protein
MGKAISGGQARSLIASFSVDIPWDKIKVDVQPFIDLPPDQKGKLFAAFIENRFRLTINNSKLLLTKPFDPTEFLGKGWTVWKGSADGDGLTGERDVDPRSETLTEIELTKFVFETCLRTKEKSIDCEEKIRRLKEKKSDLIRFGGNVFLAIWEDYQENGINGALEWLYQNFGITFLDFSGLILRDSNGWRYVLFLLRGDDGTWTWNHFWLGLRYAADRPSACCAS